MIETFEFDTFLVIPRSFRDQISQGTHNPGNLEFSSENFVFEVLYGFGSLDNSFMNEASGSSYVAKQHYKSNISLEFHFWCVQIKRKSTIFSNILF